LKFDIYNFQFAVLHGMPKEGRVRVRRRMRMRERNEESLPPPLP
jgi:hypothetical protein